MAVVPVVAMRALRLLGRRLAAPVVAFALVVGLDLARRVRQLLEFAAVEPHTPAFGADVDLHLVTADVLHAFVAVRAHQQRHLQRLRLWVGRAAARRRSDGRCPRLAKARPPHRQFNRARAADPGTEAP
jgi:hypothetical protein